MPIFLPLLPVIATTSTIIVGEVIGGCVFVASGLTFFYRSRSNKAGQQQSYNRTIPSPPSRTAQATQNETSIILTERLDINNLHSIDENKIATHPEYQQHMLRVKHSIIEIQRNFAWAQPPHLVLRLTNDEIADFVVECRIILSELNHSVERYKNKLGDQETMTASIESITQEVLSNTQSLFKCFKKYEHQLNNRATELFGQKSDDSIADITKITHYLSEYEAILAEVTTLKAQHEAEPAKRVACLSLTQYLESYPPRNNPGLTT